MGIPGKTWLKNFWHEALAGVLVFILGVGLSVSSFADASRTVSSPDGAVETGGGIRAVETPIVSVGPEGVSLGVGAPTDLPGSESQPLPKFSGVSAPIWVNTDGPAQIADDSIFHGLTDLRIGFVNTGEISAKPMPIRISGGAALPDLVVGTVNVTLLSSATWVRAEFSVTVNNTGATDAASNTLQLYVDNVLVADDANIASTELINSITAESSATKLLSWHGNAGQYEYKVCADDTNTIAESDENNNCSATQSFTLGRPDLFIPPLMVAPNLPENTFVVNRYILPYWAVINMGDAESAGTQTTRLCIDRTENGCTIPIDTVISDTIMPSRSHVADQRWTPTELGTYYMKVCADVENTVTEWDETNNCSPIVVTIIEPPAPSNLTATAGSTSQINLAWTAPTDYIGIAGYKIERCTGNGCVNFAEIARVTATSYNDTALSPSTTYAYRVREYDVEGYDNAYSNTATATTLAPPVDLMVVVSSPGGDERQVPTAINIRPITPAANGDVTFSSFVINQGTASASSFANRFCLDATVAQCQTDIMKSLGGDQTVASLNAGETSASISRVYSNAVVGDHTVAFCTDVGPSPIAESNETNNCESRTFTVTAPPVITSFTADSTNINVGASTTLRWAVTGAAARWLDPGNTPLMGTSRSVTPTTTTRYTLRVTNAVGEDTESLTITVADTSAPTAPTLTAGAPGLTQIPLSWTASTDNVGVTEYAVERCSGASCTPAALAPPVAVTPPTTTYNNTGLPPSTSYSYRVKAKDAAGNWSAYSNVLTVSTTADTTAPNVPTGLAATAASATQINLTWTAPTDNVAVTGYKIERCTGTGCTSFTQIATATSTTYSNTGLTEATTYLYRVRANDAAGNNSGYSATASARTLDVTAPSTPTGLSATAASATQIDLSWTASTDNVGVADYRIERCTGSGCTNFAQIITAIGTTKSDTELTALATYRYRIRARDAASNYSGYSSIVTRRAGANFPTPNMTGPSIVGSTIYFPGTVINDGNIPTGATSSVRFTFGQIVRNQSVPSLAADGSFQFNFSMATPAPSTTVHNYSICADAGSAIPELNETDNCYNGTFYIGAPTIPTGVTATASCSRGSPQISLNWNDSAGATEYWVYRCSGSGCNPNVTIGTEMATPTASAYANTPLSNNTTYQYKIRAYNTLTNQYSAPTSSAVGTTTGFCFADTGEHSSDRVSFLNFDPSFLQASVLTDEIGTDFLSDEESVSDAPFITSSFSAGIPIASASSHTSGIAIAGTADDPYMTLYNPVTIYDDLYIYGNNGLAGVPAEAGNMAIAGKLYAQNGIMTSLIEGGDLNILGTAQIFGDLRVLAGDATFDGDLKVYGNIGRFYEKVSAAVSATPADFAETSTTCDAGDALWSCTAEFSADPDAGSSYSWFPVTDYSVGRCAVKAKVSGGSAKPVSAQAICFSPDG